jgi:putative ABC transport system ATP-binding protein
MRPLIQAQNLTKKYQRGAETIEAVKEINLEVRSGDYIAFNGVSGSGKTTLLHLLGCLDEPSAGDLYVNDKLIFSKNTKLNERKLTRLRAETFGYIFQKFYLIPTLNVMENIMLPFAFYKKKNLTRSAKDIADRLGISHRLNHLPREISGGEMQRVAIARALVNHPPILLADEPTGNLDSKRSQEIAEILNQLNQEDKITIILVTHNQQLAENANSIIELRDGQIL